MDTTTPESSVSSPNDSQRQIFPVMGMTCAGCAASVESVLGRLDEVNSASVNYAAASVLVEYSGKLDARKLKKKLQSAGYDLVIETENAEAIQADQKAQAFAETQRRTIWAAILTVPVFIIGMFFMEWEAGRWISLALTVPVLGYFGRGFFIGAFKLARHGQANMDTLVALSTGIAFLFSLFSLLFPDFWRARGIVPHVYFEAVTVIIVFVSLGKLLEERAKSQTSGSIRKLMDLQPQRVWLVEEEAEREIPVEEVQVGQMLRVKPGARVPVDGVVRTGQSFVDESMLSGEAIPVAKSPENEVFAGTINQQGSFIFEAQRVGAETVLAQIIRRVREAQGSKAPVQRLVDKIAGIFVPVVMGIAALTFVVWMVAGGENAFSHALLASVSVLVIACPCALGLATPTAIMVGMGRGAEHQILIQDAESLELGHRVTTVVLDKTGTLTTGQPEVREVIWLRPEAQGKAAPVLLALESQSEHPLAAAVVRHLHFEGVAPATISGFESQTGRGVTARDPSGQVFSVGNLSLMESQGIEVPAETDAQASALQSTGATVVFVGMGQGLVGLVVIGDAVKPTAAKALEALRQRGIGVCILSGDNERTVAALATQLGVSDYQGGCLPADKAAEIAARQRRGEVVAMVGDGINDSEALAQADVGIAMGTGSDIAMEVAPITLVTQDLMALPRAFVLSRKTVAGIRQNLFWAFVYNVVGIPIAAGALYPFTGFLLDPMIAGAAMALSSVSVVGNSLRLRGMDLG